MAASTNIGAGTLSILWLEPDIQQSEAPLRYPCGRAADRRFQFRRSGDLSRRANPGSAAAVQRTGSGRFTSNGAASKGTFVTAGAREALPC